MHWASAACFNLFKISRNKGLTRNHTTAQKTGSWRLTVSGPDQRLHNIDTPVKKKSEVAINRLALTRRIDTLIRPPFVLLAHVVACTTIIVYVTPQGVAWSIHRFGDAAKKRINYREISAAPSSRM